MKELHIKAVELLKRRENFIIATILDKSGSMPRGTGAKMLVLADGSIVGTIGGGQLEANVIHTAVQALTLRQTILQLFHLTSKDTNAINLYAKLFF